MEAITRINDATKVPNKQPHPLYTFPVNPQLDSVTRVDRDTQTTRSSRAAASLARLARKLAPAAVPGAAQLFCVTRKARRKLTARAVPCVRGPRYDRKTPSGVAIRSLCPPERRLTVSVWCRFHP
ncbi:unnamed protein product [Pleuronectes platessa]|uniref:Uncharacterized protein n=1 Tax=Pleuronectes platessa TaxID=8262 RepID=A0A9N7YJ70_PLEPL|nr:unnamed protein product [Pleuronectes platessa]